jgi:hypothetical protein
MLQGLWTRLAGLVVRCYPHAWRDRYEPEMLALIEATPARPAIVIDLLSGLLRERGVYRGTRWTALLIGRIAWAWIVAMASVAALWILFVVTFAPYGAEWFGFDRSEWMAKRLLDTRMVLQLATFYILPTMLIGLPGVVLLFIVRVGRRPWLARAAALSSFMLFSVWWDATLFFSTHGWRSVWGWSPEFGHFAAMIAGWLIAVWLFPRHSRANGTPAADRAELESASDSHSSPRGILRARLAPEHEAV